MPSETTREWRTLADGDPLYAVAAHPGREGEWDASSFYALGRADWDDFKARWSQYAVLGGTCVDVGCGAGRITAALADTFSSVIGVDVADPMLELARQAAPAATFLRTDDERLPLPNGSADAVFTCHVLQHFENIEAVADSFAEMARVLRPSGTVMAHLLLEEGQPSMWRKAASEAKLRWTRLRQSHRGSYSRVRRYQPVTVRAAMVSAGFADIELREFAVTSNGDPHAFWFGRRV